MKTEPIGEEYTFKWDMPQRSLTLTFEPMLGKPSPRAQAALHALELNTEHRLPIELWQGNCFISTLGRKH